MNILGIISCDDLSKYTYDEIMPGHYIFNELAIHTEKKTKDILLFRLQEHSPTIIIHKSVLKYIVDNDPDETLLGWEADDIIQ
ncbi:MAG: hypothetical protein P8Z77_01425 [Candidatus Thiodiazotropha sp.]